MLSTALKTGTLINMLPKKNRLSRKQFDHVYTDGVSVSGGIGYIKILRTEKPAQISCVVSSNEADTSVERTRVRRRGYAAVEKIINKIPSKYSIIWFLPARAELVSIDNLRAGFTDILDKHGVFWVIEIR